MNDPQSSAEYRQARRDAVKAHHPDLGGDPAVLDDALAAIDHRFGVGRQRQTSQVTVFRTKRASAATVGSSIAGAVVVAGAVITSIIRNRG